ncbi:hypothetical protein ASG52_21385 [Methylobacterium sp. Leaf456]|uniref:glycosyltransferase n=1 Tax=Methylobacterium sp. Leaf456 TaxID=1736382 RepID=UPI0006FB5AE8|nr:glycosyltransferase [Methylobacterium sp. Leaf456]KQT58686.1 hypothetical protein ASG52_21385 [Methylobacterium sp. Leaf456]
MRAAGIDPGQDSLGNGPAGRHAGPDSGFPGIGMISGFVISHNRERLIETCLRSIRFVDELIVLDMSSTDGTAEIARRYADRVVTVPLATHPEGVRTQAAAACRGDFVVFLDDDECLSPEAIAFLAREGRDPSADVYRLPCRHHILGRHDERAYYWPQRHVRAFRRGGLEFAPTVHAGLRLLSDRVCDPAFESRICFHNISHADTGQWVEKMNRYTSVPDRNSSRHAVAMKSPLRFAKSHIAAYARGVPEGGDPYLEAVAVLRAVYDIVDALKLWEARQEESGAERFAGFCAAMGERYDALEVGSGLATGPDGREARPRLRPGESIALSAPHAALALVEGWGRREGWGRWTLGPRADLDLRLAGPDGGGAVDLVVSARPYFAPGEAEARVTARLGDGTRAEWHYRADEAGPAARRIRVSAACLAAEPVVRLVLEVPGYRRPGPAAEAGDRRRFGLGVGRIAAEPA